MSKSPRVSLAVRIQERGVSSPWHSACPVFSTVYLNCFRSCTMVPPTHPMEFPPPYEQDPFAHQPPLPCSHPLSGASGPHLCRVCGPLLLLAPGAPKLLVYVPFSSHIRLGQEADGVLRVIMAPLFLS